MRESETAESVNEYFTKLLEGEDEKAIIETIFVTTLDNFGTTCNLICRKLAHKINNMLSEKIISDLVLAEENEKKQKAQEKNPTKKKNNKKKKNKKDGKKYL